MKKKKRHSLSYLLTPDYMFNTFDEVTPDFLISHGIDALLIDIDNTLAPYEQSEPDERIINWFDGLKQNGIRASLISNNHADRVRLFADALGGVPAYPDCGKPRLKYLRIALAELGVEASRAAVLGDQLLTDCLSARRMGMKAYIVPPIKDKTTFFFRSKRWLERPFMRTYDRIHRKEQTK